jgi:hypothetical protein
VCVLTGQRRVWKNAANFEILSERT